MSDHVHGFLCPETDAHAETPIYDEAAFDHGFAPMPADTEAGAA